MATTIALCSPELKPGDVKFNTEKIIDCLAKTKNADIVVFPRLCITGATCGDMYAFPTLSDAAFNALQTIAAACSPHETVILGLPLQKTDGVYDATAIVRQGKTCVYCMPKGITDVSSSCIKYGSDDVPNMDGEIKISIRADFDNPHESDCVVVPSAFASYVRNESEIKAKMCSFPYVTAAVSSGKGESVSNKIMSGFKALCSGGKVKEYADWDNDVIVAKIPKCSEVFTPYSPQRNQSLIISDFDECMTAYKLMARGISSRMEEIGTDKVILGLSGGIDSTNVLMAAITAFDENKIDRKNIICVTMRGAASTRRTQDNANALIEAFKVTGQNVPIDSAVTLHLRAINHTLKDVVYENAQARERTQILLDLSNKYNALMLGTGDLSEICLGWSTFGGDQLSQYNPNCSVLKTSAQNMLRAFANTKTGKCAAKIIADILDTPISPELLEQQSTENSIGPYRLHDYFIDQMFGKKAAPSAVYRSAIQKFDDSPADIKKCLLTMINRMFKYQFKRNFGSDGVQLFENDLCNIKVRSDFRPQAWLSDLDRVNSEN